MIFCQICFLYYVLCTAMFHRHSLYSFLQTNGTWYLYYITFLRLSSNGWRILVTRTQVLGTGTLRYNIISGKRYVTTPTHPTHPHTPHTPTHPHPTANRSWCCNVRIVLVKAQAHVEVSSYYQKQRAVCPQSLRNYTFCGRAACRRSCAKYAIKYNSICIANQWVTIEYILSSVLQQIPKLKCFAVVCPIHWSQVLSREWRCSWSNADRRCSNYIRMINNFIGS